MHVEVKKIHEEFEKYLKKYSAHEIADKTGYSLHYVQSLKNKSVKIKCFTTVLKWIAELKKMAPNG